MTDNEVSEAVTVTDAQVDDFFESGGEFKETSKVDEVKPVDTKEVKTEEEKPDDKVDNKVNYGALHEERMRRKEAAERAKKAEEERDELRKQLQKFSQPKQEENFDDDPLEAVRRENQQIKNVLIAQANKALQQDENSKYWAKVKESEIAYKQDKPDFDDAISFLANSRLEELKDLGWNDAEAQKVLSDEIRWIADKAYADEVNPAERFHNLAKRRGFKVEAKEPVKEDTSADEKLSKIKRGIETNRQLPPASKSVKQDLTAESLADMNIDALSNLTGQTDFDKAWSKLFGNA